MPLDSPLDPANAVDWLFLDLNSFFASCEQQHDPKLRGRPVGVVPMTGVDTTCLLAASYEAKKLGLRTGTPVGEARIICPEIVLIQAQHKRYVHYHKRVIEVVESCTPIDHIASIDEMACRLTGSQRDPENAFKLALKIKQEIHEQIGPCLTSSIGIAPNVFLSKLGSDMQKPDGLVIIRPRDLPHKIENLALRDLYGIGYQTEKRLNAAGVFTIKDLYRYDRRRMRALWGSVEGERMYANLRGQKVERPPSKKTVIGHQHVLEPCLRNTRSAEDVLHHLLSKAAERLRGMEHSCRTLSISVKFDRHQGHWYTDTNFAHTQDTQFLLQIFHRLWRDYPGLRPLRVGVMLGDLYPMSAHQADLFQRARPQQLLSALDNINQKFGRHTVNFGLNDYVQQKVGKDKIAFNRVPELREV